MTSSVCRLWEPGSKSPWWGLPFRSTVAACALVALLPARASRAAPAPAPSPTPTPRSVGALVFDGVPEVPPALRQRVLQYTGARSARLVDWSPDGRGVLMLTRFGETNQLHHVAAPLGARTQWTFLDEPVGFAAPRPLAVNAKAKAALPATDIVIGIDRGGSEFYQLALLRKADGSLAVFTDGTSRHETPVWSRDGRKVAFVGTGRNGKDFDVYVWDAPPPARVGASAEGPLAVPVRVAELSGTWRVEDWSPDATRLMLIKYLSIEQSEPHVLDLATGKVTPLLPDQVGKRVAVGDARFGRGGEVWLTSDLDADVHRLGRRGADGKLEWLTTAIAWNVEHLDVAPDGRVAFLVNEDGGSRLYVLGAGNVPEAVPGLPVGVAAGLRWSPDGRDIAVSLAAADSPGDVWTARVPTASAGKSAAGVRVQRWTESEVGGLDPAGFVTPTRVRYPTFDQVGTTPRQLPCLVYKPKGRGPFPFVVHIHGGPEGQARPGFDPSIQLWVRELGLAVLVPNVRGSDGYGKQYLALDNGIRREDSVADIGALLDWAATQPDLDAKRAAVYGGSYGGYMVLASLVKFGDRLRAGIDIVGISNFVTFLENTQAYRRDNRRAEYGDERDPAMRTWMQQASPLTHAGRIRSPLFVVQGANDPRVPQSEAEQLVAAVKQAGKAVWYLLARDEGHGFQKKANRDAMVQSVARFWQLHLIN
ncbi:MAG: S9 family peptidase [Myxococcales bacterium]|nr:S9 family peptidase [Myxococcales bacterium]